MSSTQDLAPWTENLEPGYVYAIGDGEGHVKIGWSLDPRRRLNKIKTDCPGDVTLIGMITATRDQEAETHKLLAQWRISREWFRLEGVVAEFVASLPVPSPPPEISEITDPITFIRKRILGVSQFEMAVIAGVGQSTISKWEAGQGSPCLAELGLIRAAIIARDLDWEDSWLFEIPNSLGAPV